MQMQVEETAVGEAKRLVAASSPETVKKAFIAINGWETAEGPRSAENPPNWRFLL